MSAEGAGVAVLIPVYNEAMTISQVIKSFRKALPKAKIYVYDNNSTDGSGEIARKSGAIVCSETRQGKGNVVRAMFRDIDADCYLLVDGDNTYPAESSQSMVSLVMEKGYDMVIGDRLSSTYFTENTRRFHSGGNLLVRLLINILFRKKIDLYAYKNIIVGGGGEPVKGIVTDIMTGYRAFSPLFVKSFPILSEGFEIETEMTVHALDKNFALASLPVPYRDRPAGSSSKLRTFPDGIKVLKTIAGLLKNYRPFVFFNVASGLMFLVSIFFLFPVLSVYFSTGLVPRLPTFIASCFAMLCAILLFFCGVILEVVTRHQRFNYELQLLLVHAQLKKHRHKDSEDE